jgi:hypothetical protein
MSIEDDELDRIERRAAAAFAVLRSPWSAYLETRAGIGGGSFIGTPSEHDGDDEMYITLLVGGKELTSPDPRLDAVLDFIASASADVPKLVAEVRRLRRRAQ